MSLDSSIGNYSYSKYFIFSSILFLAFGLVFFLGVVVLNQGILEARADDHHEEELRSEIEARNKELAELQKEIAEAEGQLRQAEGQSRTFSGEVQRLENTIRQLNLGIRSAEVSIAKLNLELSALSGEIKEIEEGIKTKNVSMGDILRVMQFREGESVLLALLKTEKLSDGVNAVQTLLDLNNKVLVEVESLKNLKSELEERIEKQENKRVSIELENNDLSIRKSVVDEQQKEKQVLLSFSKQQEEQYLRELKELEERQEEIAKEIEDIERQLLANIDPSLLPAEKEFLSMPFRIAARVTQGYGNNDAFARATYAGGFHNGIDYAMPVGTPLYASASGVVVAAVNQDRYCPRGAYGGLVAIRHQELELATLYAHMSSIGVSIGQRVERGELIGYSGNTGLSTGPHLHFTVYLDQPGRNTFYIGPSRYCGPQMPFGAHVNPNDYLD